MKERGRIKRIEKNLGRKITEAEIPGKQEICNAQLLSLIEKVKTVNVDEDMIAPYMGVIEEKLAGFTGEELVKKFVSLEFNQFLDFYKDLEDFKPVKRGNDLDFHSNRDYSRDRRNDRRGPRGSDGPPRGRKKERGGQDGDYAWLKINLGRRDGVSAPELMKLINQNTRGKSIDLGRIDIQPTNTRFQVEKSAADYLTTVLRRKVYNGRRIRID